jgi:hypothetical protein
MGRPAHRFAGRVEDPGASRDIALELLFQIPTDATFTGFSYHCNTAETKPHYPAIIN